MNESIIFLQNKILAIWLYTENSLKIPLKTLDPALFQNIILGILAIFIPFAIVFLTDVLGSRKESKSEFEKMVLNGEVLGTVRVFWLSIVGIATLAFFSGKDISIERKLLAMTISVIIVWLFWKPFNKIMRFAEGHKPEFELSFLKSLNLSRFFRFNNKIKMERIKRAWESFWPEKSSPYNNERDFTQAFIRHIDDAIKIGRFDFAVAVAQTYSKNIEKREKFSVGYYLLPKVFEWHEMAWIEERAWLRRQDFKEKIMIARWPSFIKKSFHFVVKWIYEKDDFYFSWHYFQQDLFPAVAKILLSDGYQLFASFGKHIADIEAQLEKIEDEKEREIFWNNIQGWFVGFCPMFFANVDSLPGSGFDIWQHYFPVGWKITSTNAERRIPRIILHEFLEWSESRIIKKNPQDYDSDLSEVAGGIFPSVHPELFPAFLILLFFPELEYAVKKEASFYLMSLSVVSWEGERTEEEIQQAAVQQAESQKEETIEIILKYFSNWKYLKPYKDDLSEEEFTNWKSYNEEQRKEIVKRVRKTKLQGLLDELKSAEMVKICQESEKFENQRKSFIELINLLLEKI